MITDRVLIFANYPLNPTDGGPSGFIAQNLLGHDSKIYEVSGTKSLSNSLKKRISKKTRQLLNLDYKYVVDADLHKANKLKFLGQSVQKHFIDVGARHYKFIYFHDIWTMKSCIPLLNPKQVTLLQPHCPELPSEEIASPLHPDSNHHDIEWTKKAERDAFDRADILIFPNPYAAEIYAPLIKKNSKILYISSGAKQIVDLRKYPLDHQKINFLYMGRRNNIKGFDIVFEGFRSAYSSRKDIALFLVGGGERIDEEGIYDIGFTNSPHQWIYNSDYVINCNRQSYFDLSIMETLSIGTPIILSGNYGHKEIVEDASSGIIDIGESTVENLKKILLSYSLNKKEKNQKAVDDNKRLYQIKYSTSVYRDNLEGLLHKIIYSLSVNPHI